MPSSLNVRLTLRSLHGGDRPPIARRREPVTVGLPFPRGALRTTETLRLIDSAGTPRPLQARALDYWSDRSIRWALFDFQADAPAGEATYVLDEHPRDQASGQPVMTVTPHTDRVEIDTGAGIFFVARGAAFPFSSVIVGDRPVLAQPARLTVLDETGTPCRVEVTTIHVDEHGPLRSAIAIGGVVRRANGDRLLQLRARLHFFAGSPAVRMHVCLRNPKRAVHAGNFWDLGDPNSVLLKDASLTWTLAGDAAVQAAAPAPVQVYCSAEPSAPFAPTAMPFELYQDSSGGEHWQSRNHINRNRDIPVTFRGYRLTAGSTTAEGLRATPIVGIGDGTSGISVAMRAFWENFPKAIDVTDRTITLRLFPRQFRDLFEIQGGEQKTHEVVVSFGDEGITEMPLAWVRDPLIASATPEWYASTGAVPYLTTAAEDSHATYASLIRAAIDGDDTFVHKREVIDQYGWRHFGDVYGDHENGYFKGEKPIVSHYNNQYDTVAGFTYQFLRSGDLRWHRQMIDLAAHVVDIDVYHTTEDKSAFNHGMFWHTYHYGDADTAAHRTYPRAGQGATHGGGPSADHNYTTGLMLHSFMTGDPWSRETAIDLAQYVIDIDDGRLTVFRWLDSGRTGLATASGSYSYHGPGRGPANSLNALIDGHRLTGDSKFIDKADEIVRRCVHPREDIAVHDLLDAENKWFYTMFFQSLGKYLLHKAEMESFDASYVYARESLLHFARWMAANEVPTLDRPERLHFPTETWAAQDVRKSDVLYHASAHATGDERARLRERAAFFFDHSLATLASKPTRTYARPVIVLLSSGLLHAWFQRHPAFHLEARAPEGMTFGDRPPFVPQKARAKKRLIALAAAVAALGLVALVLLVVLVLS